MIVYRVQDRDGRGPWKPGLSRYWVEDSSAVGPLQETIMDLCGGFSGMEKLERGWHYACACRSPEALAAWFTPVEAIRLAAMGYAPVRIKADRVPF